MIGTRLGPYEICQEIGRGGMAIVYRAYQASMERDVALKVVSKALVQEEIAISRFQREARLVARLEHPNILPIYDFDGRSDPPYLVMRYLDGGTLEGLLRQGQLPFDRLRFLMGQICSALDYAHRQGIVHRDIKPSNILLDQDGNAFVSDFGIARMVSEPESLRITHDGVILGTFDYMAPEQFMDSNVTHQADLYALGVILYQMLTGEMPYPASNLMSLLAQRMRQPLPRVTALRPDLPFLLDEVAARALADDPQQRYSSAAAFYQALTAALERTLSEGAAQPPPPKEEASSPLAGARLTTLVLEETRTPAPLGAFTQNRLEGVETPLIGRDAEMKTLQNAMRGVMEERETHMVTVVGAAGLGKSRLVHEFYRWLYEHEMDYRRLRGRATPEMANQPYALLRDTLSPMFRIRDSDPPPTVRQKLEAGLVAPPGQPHASPDPETAHLIGYLAGYDLGESPYLQARESDAQRLAGQAQAAFFAWVRRLSQAHPALVVLEDLHYADSASLDLLNALVRQVKDIPVLIIGLARPEFIIHRPDWGSGQSNHTRLEMRPLDKWDSRSLLRAILRKVTDPPKVLMDLLVERAEGNPYYLEELVRMLIDERVILRPEPEAWQVEIGRLDENAVPATLVELIQANLEGLLPAERLILQRAAVIGRVFYDGALAALDAVDARHLEEQGQFLARLAASGHIQRRESSAFSGSLEYIFPSGMSHDVLLSMLEADQRRVYHRAAASWLETAAGQRVEEWSSVIAGHYAAAGEDRLAASWYILSGKTAFQQDASHEAVQLYRRALALLPEDAQERADLLQRWQANLGLCDALKRRNQFEACLMEGENLLALAQALQDPSRQAEATLRIGHVYQSLGHFDQALEHYQETMRLAEEAGDPANHALAQALQVFCWVQMGYLEQAGAASEEVLGRVKDLQDNETLVRVYHNTAMYFSAMGDYARAVQLTRQHVDMNRQLGNRYGEAMGLANEGYYEVMMGLYDLAQTALERSNQLLEKLGDQQALAYNQLNLGLCYLLRGTLDPSQPDIPQMAQAETRFQLAQAILEGLQDAFGLAASQVYLGLAYEARLDWTAAAGCYAAAARRYENIGALAVALDAQAGLARCALEPYRSTGQEAAAQQEALAAILPVWEALQGQSGGGMEFPALAYLTCIQVFSAIGMQEQALAAHQVGCEWLRQRADRISEPAWQESFLHNVPAHLRLGQTC